MAIFQDTKGKGCLCHRKTLAEDPNGGLNYFIIENMKPALVESVSYSEQEKVAMSVTQGLPLVNLLENQFVTRVAALSLKVGMELKLLHFLSQRCCKSLVTITVFSLCSLTRMHSSFGEQSW